MREIRAVVGGLLVVVLVTLALAIWRRPARELRHIRGYRVEIRKSEGDSRKRVSFSVPISLVARIASLAPVADIGGDLKADWGDGEVTAHDLLDAADRSAPGRPGVITKGRSRIEVTVEGSALEILATDDWNKSVRLRVPRALVEGFSRDGRISPREILRRLDELGPGEVVVIRDRDDQVTITAEPR